MLLATRQMLLERAGINVQTALGLAGLVDITAEELVLCHTLSEAERIEAIGSVRSYRPGARVLVLLDNADDPISRACETLPPLAPPLH